MPLATAGLCRRSSTSPHISINFRDAIFVSRPNTFVTSRSFYGCPYKGTLRRFLQEALCCVHAGGSFFICSTGGSLLTSSGFKRRSSCYWLSATLICNQSSYHGIPRRRIFYARLYGRGYLETASPFFRSHTMLAAAFPFQPHPLPLRLWSKPPTS